VQPGHSRLAFDAQGIVGTVRLVLYDQIGPEFAGLVFPCAALVVDDVVVWPVHIGVIGAAGAPPGVPLRLAAGNRGGRLRVRQPRTEEFRFRRTALRVVS
jgi:hypothetical protein